MYLTEMIEEMGHDVEEWGETKQMILLEAPTGCGKTVFAQQFLTKICLEKGSHLALIVNRRVLKEQVEKKNTEFIFRNNLYESPLNIYTYQELEQDGKKTKEKLEYLETCEFVVCDEAAYWVFDSSFNPAAEKSFLMLMGLIGKTSLIMMTATPKRLKTFLDEYLDSVNRQRQEEWKKYYMEWLKQLSDYVFYSPDEANGSWVKYAKLLENYPELLKHYSELREYEENLCETDSESELPIVGLVNKPENDPDPEPEPYSYKLISQQNQDYAYVKLNCYSSQKKLLEMIIESPKREKWLIFVNTRKDGKKLKNEITKAFKKNGSDNRSVSFLSADYEKNEKMKKIVHTIVKEERYKQSVLISTSVLDTGITISDNKVRNIVINTPSEDEFKQMLGRRRIKKGEKINLFICGSLSYFKKCRKHTFDSFINAFPIIGKEPDQISDAILERKVIWKTIDEYAFQEKSTYKFSKLSYLVHRQKFENLDNIIQDMESDPDAYIKLVCRWLGKNPDSDVEYCIETTADSVYKEIADKILTLGQVISADEYTNFVKGLKEIAGEAISRNKFNEFLSQNEATDKYFFMQEKINKSVYYFIETEGEFPFQLSQDITDINNLKTAIKEIECSSTEEIFKRLFNTDMPNIVKQVDQSKFVSICVKNKKGFEDIPSLRRNGKKFGFYEKKATNEEENEDLKFV